MAPKPHAHLACPHCGFRNPATDPYCGRCERPMRGPKVGEDAWMVREATPPVAIPAPAPQAAPPQTAPQAPPPLRPVEAQSPPPAIQQAAQRLKERQPRPPVPPPEVPQLPPTPVPVPSERELKRRRTQQQRQRLALQADRPGIARLITAQAVDVGLVIAAGVTTAGVETLLLGQQDDRFSPLLMDVFANFIDAHPSIATHGLMASIAVGAVGAWLGSLRGTTPGRRLMGLVLVKDPAATPRRLLVRAGLAPLSGLCFMAGFFWAIVDGNGASWHDRVGRTRVVVGS